MTTPPPLTIGMPVYNGARFLAETLDSLRAQTFADFELVITDNASTDETARICHDYMARDPRIRYHRHDRNLGAAVNYTSCFERARSPYFKWAAHDDPCEPELLERCMDALEARPEAVLAYSRTRTVDEDGHELKRWRARPALTSPRARDRARDVLDRRETFPVWGVVRRDVLARTGLLGSFTEHDRPLLYQLALHGPFVEIPEFLFCDREHAGRSVRAFDHTDPYVAATWYDTSLSGRLIFPAWRLLGEYLLALHRSPVPALRSGPHVADLGRWAAQHRQELGRDVLVAASRLPLVGGLVRNLGARSADRRWRQAEARAVETLRGLDDAGILLVDEDVLDRTLLPGLDVRHFPAGDDGWAGLPASSDDAIAALTREVAHGAGYLALLSESQWWLDHYDAFAAYLEDHARPLVEIPELTVYELDRALAEGAG